MVDCNHAIEYRLNEALAVDDFIDLLRRSSLADRRPVDDRACMEGMLQHGNLLVCAWHQARLVGVARSLTDFHYACYLSDLAVDQAYQQQGIGRRLLALTQSQLGPHGKIILLAAPAAKDYYGHLGFVPHDRCWVLERRARLRD